MTHFLLYHVLVSLLSIKHTTTFSKCIKTIFTTNNDNIVFGIFGSMLSDIGDPGSRKSVNMTECVPVPSSEHVAEIVARQGTLLQCIRFPVAYHADRCVCAGVEFLGGVRVICTRHKMQQGNVVHEAC